MLIKNIRFLVSQNSHREILEHVDILIEGNIIKEIGKNLFGEPVIDATHFIVIPGLINGHTHNTMTALRGICDDEQLHTWLDTVVKAELAMSKEEQFSSSLQGIREMLRTGTTTFCDMYVDVFPTLDAAQHFGIRALLFKAYFDAFGDKEFDKDEFLALKQCVSKSSLITLGLGPHSIYGCSEKMLREISVYAKECNIRKHIHLAETRKERFDILNKTKKLPLEYLSSIDFLDNRTTLVHNIWLTKGELDIAKSEGASLVHCPTSNMKLAGGGVMPLVEAQGRNILCSLGTDSAVSNNSLDMFSEMKIAALLHKHHRWDATAAPAQLVFDLATIQGACAFGLDTEVGSLEVGKKADLVFVDMHSENLVGTKKERVISNLVYACSGYNVDTVIIDGVIRVRDKKVLD